MQAIKRVVFVLKNIISKKKKKERNEVKQTVGSWLLTHIFKRNVSRAQLSD